MKRPDYKFAEPGEPFVLTWKVWRNWFWFLLSSPRAGKLKIQIADYGYDPEPTTEGREHGNTNSN